MRNLTQKFVFDDPDNSSHILCDTTKDVEIPRIDEYDTGDLILFTDRTYFPSRMTEWIYTNKYSNVGIILKNPTFIDPSLKGIYLFDHQSAPTTTNTQLSDKIKKLTDVYKEYKGAMFWRKRSTDQYMCDKKVNLLDELQTNNIFCIDKTQVNCKTDKDILIKSYDSYVHYAYCTY